MKKNILFLGFFLGFFLMVLSYINRTYVDVYFFDGLLEVFDIEKYYKGTFSFADLKKPFGEHRLVGYKIFCILNAKFFSFNMKTGAVVFLFAYSFIGFILYALYKRFLSKNLTQQRNLGIQLSYVIILSVIFSLVHPPYFFMSVQFVVGTAFFLIAALFFDEICLNNTKPLVIAGYVFFITVYIVVFSGAYFGGALFSFLACLFFILIFSGYKKINPYILISTGILMLLIAGYLSFANTSQGGSLSLKIKTFLFEMPGTLKSLLAGISGSTLDIHTYEYLNSESVILINGGVLFLIGAYSIYRFIVLKMYEKTYLPLLLIMYTIGLIFTIRLGRLTMQDWSGAMNEWYSFHLYFYLIGVLWILFFDLFKRFDATQAFSLNISNRNKLLAFISVLSIGYIFTVQCYSNVHQWNRTVNVHKWMVEKRQNLINPSEKSYSENIYLTKKATLHAIAFLKKNELSCFKNEDGVTDENSVRIGNNIHSAHLEYGWHDWEEDNTIWMKKEAVAYFYTGLSGKMILKAYLPTTHLPNTVTIFINDKEVKEYNITQEEINIESINIPTNDIVKLKLVIKNAIIPKNVGIGADERELGILISNIRFY